MDVRDQTGLLLLRLLGSLRPYFDPPLTQVEARVGVPDGGASLAFQIIYSTSGEALRMGIHEFIPSVLTAPQLGMSVLREYGELERFLDHRLFELLIEPNDRSRGTRVDDVFWWHPREMSSSLVLGAEDLVVS